MWRKLGLGALGLVGVVLVGGGAFVGYRLSVFPPTFPDEPQSDLRPSTDPEVIAKGRYLVDAVAHCTVCHTREEDFKARDSVEGILPSGGHEWVMGPMGTVRSANITSDPETGIGAMSDAELARILKHAVDADGDPKVMMVAVGPMADEDLVAVMSYIRSLPPVKNKVQPSELTTMGKVVMPLMAPAYLAPKPDWPLPPRVDDGEISVARGNYLANGPAFCFACHSQPVLSPRLGVVEPRFAGCITPDPDPLDPEMELCAPNLTPDPETGFLAAWSEDAFVSRFRGGRAVEHSPMPWENFGLMTENDLRSIFRYLQSLEPTRRVTGPPYRKAGWTPG
ncbi:MAG: cytochrome C [Deltaproteobacteria bacterium]|nr:MAG: cytochrome C [Deltaproteobacteria bacterium]